MVEYSTCSTNCYIDCYNLFRISENCCNSMFIINISVGEGVVGVAAAPLAGQKSDTFE